MTSIDMSHGLDWLIHPFGSDEFYKLHYETAPLCVRRDNAAYFAGLPDLDSVDELLSTTVSNRVNSRHGERLTRFEADGSSSDRSARVTSNASVDIHGIYRSYHSGFTVVINQVHRRSSPVARLCRGLQATMHHPIGANLYLTPESAQGFPPHVDTHDVFVLQLHGTKEWHVSTPTSPLPLAQTKYKKQEIPDFQVYDLSPGDMLYLPRGYRHEAITGASSSLHLTIGINAFRWHDLFSEALELLADEDVALRNALPAGYMRKPLDMDYVKKVSRRVAEALCSAELMGRAKERIASRFLASDAAAGISQFRSLDAVASLTSTSIVARRPETLCLVGSANGRATIEFGGNYVSGPDSIAPTLQFVAENEQFAIGDLPGRMHEEDRMELIKRLVTEGLLEVLQK
ncbi:cupin domain-containing protein [Streptomyces sp. NPDC093225]|uniref:cupin domain-containing protein n=1 Tax=Streptomyces sp. NPDC093225 TaxID=3366034 RepID=UPI003822C84F